MLRFEAVAHNTKQLGCGRTLDKFATIVTRLAELGKYEKERRKANAKPLPPPNPQALASAYLLKAGFTAGDLAAAEPLLKTPAGDHSVEKQLSGAEPNPTWGKAAQ